MKPYGCTSRKARTWHVWGDKIPKKNRRYFNKSVRKLMKQNVITLTKTL